MNALETFFKERPTALDYFNAYVRYLHRLLRMIDMDSVRAIASCFLKARANDQGIFFGGNGGSAATTSPFAQDLTEVGRKAKVRSFRTVSLTDNISFYLILRLSDEGKL